MISDICEHERSINGYYYTSICVFHENYRPILTEMQFIFITFPTFCGGAFQ